MSGEKDGEMMRMDFTIYECIHCHRGGNLSPEQITALNRNGRFKCSCGGELTTKEAIRGLLLSHNRCAKLALISDSVQNDVETDIVVGEAHHVKFQNPFKKIHKVYLTQKGEGNHDFVHLCIEPKFVRNDSFQIISSRLSGQTTPEKCSVSWVAYGNTENRTLDIWEEILLSSVEYELKDDWKGQIITCQTAFEIYLDSIIRSRFKEKYSINDGDLDDILDSFNLWKKLEFWMNRLYGKGANSCNLYEEWKDDVYKLRNEIVHEGKINLTRDESINALRIVYEYIQEIENLRKSTTT